MVSVIWKSLPAMEVAVKYGATTRWLAGMAG
jgi:hypothetical protein